jgi:hypothetical protein
MGRFVRRRAVAVSLAAFFAALTLFAGARFAESLLERAVSVRIEKEAKRHGVQADVHKIKASIDPLLRLDGVRLEKPGLGSFGTPWIEVRIRPAFGGPLQWLRVSLGRATLLGPSGFSLESEKTDWDLASSPPGGLRATARSGDGALSITWSPRPGHGSRVEVAAENFSAGPLLNFKRLGATVLDAGIVHGLAWVETSETSTTFNVNVSAQGLRVAAFSGDSFARGETPTLGQPADLSLSFDGSWDSGALLLPRYSVSGEGTALSGSLALAGARADPTIDLSLGVQRVDFAKLLTTSGLERSSALGGSESQSDLGSASLSVTVHGHFREPTSFVVVQKLDFKPPARLPPAIQTLRGPFVYEAVAADGRRQSIDVSPSSPDFIRLQEVPALFIRTLLIGEDAGFYSHHGIDLSELPSALITNWTRGTVARGASTITQQLAKNLFLSREKRLSRKVQELALALLLEAALGKERILEIYLNVIEWGPDLHGLRPAARRYFHKEPAELTPKQIAFLVALIPGPLKYQRSFADGTLSAWFLSLVTDLLEKLRSVDAISPDEYEAALSEQLVIETGEGGSEIPVPEATPTPR